MKVTGARQEPISTSRRRSPIPPARFSASVEPVDTQAFLGVPQAQLAPAVRAALRTLLAELDELRGEVGRLKARLAEAESLADRDGLTPLLNRRAFVRELGRARAFSQRYGAPASLVYFDLDGFKAVNDRHGHAGGDAALRAVAERLRANVRDSDVLGRLGGDEFGLILAQADRPTAEAKACALAQTMAQTPVTFGDWSAAVQLSYGVCEISADAEPEALIARADAAMFAAKRRRKAG